MDLYIKGDIVSDDDAWVYDWLGIDCSCPKKVRNAIDSHSPDEPLDVYINSGGGDVFAGAEIYTALASIPDVKIHIVGFAGSMASVIAMAGYCEMSPVAQMMIHNVSASARGDYRAMQHSSDVLKNATETIAQAYIKKSGMSEQEVYDLMDAETWLSPQKALELNLINKISELPIQSDSAAPVKLSASFNQIPSEFIAKMQEKRQKALLNLEFLKLKGERI